MKIDDRISRRDLLKASGAIVVSFAFPLTIRDAFAQTAPPAGGRPVDSGEVDGSARDPRGRVGHPLHEQGRRGNRHPHRVRADGRRRTWRLPVARQRHRGRYGDLSGSRWNGRKHRPDSRRHGNPGGGSNRAQSVAADGSNPAESSCCRPHHRRWRGATARGRHGRRNRLAHWRATLLAESRSRTRRSRPPRSMSRSASRCFGPTCRPSAPVGMSTCRISRCPACCTAASSGLRRWARRSSRSMRARFAAFRTFASCGSRTSWRSSRRTNGQPSAPRLRSRPRGTSGRRCRDTKDSIASRAPRRSSAIRKF